MVLITNTLSAVLAGLAAGSSICRLQEVWGGAKHGLLPPAAAADAAAADAAAAITPTASLLSPGAAAAAAAAGTNNPNGPLVTPVVRPHVWEAVQGLCMHLMFLLVLPTFYHGIIDLAQRINNPFGYVYTRKY